MGQYDGRGIDGQRFFDDLAWVDAGAINRSAEHLVETQYAMPVVEIHAAEHFVTEVLNSSLQKGLGISRAADGLPRGDGGLEVSPSQLRHGADYFRSRDADAALGRQRGRISVQQLAETTESLQQALGQVTGGGSATAAVDKHGQQLGIAPDHPLSMSRCHRARLSESPQSVQAAYSALIAGFGGNADSLRAKLINMNIVLGITGGIAAYKTPDLVRRLRARGAEVQIVMTVSAEEFVTETALQAVSGRPIRSNLWDKEAEASMSHIELARWADVVLIAPATAEIMARLASGAAADLLTTLCLATEAPIAIAPAMNHVMWEKAAVQANRKTLEDRGFRILGPDHGSQACGETGAGRMLEPEEIAAIVCGPQIAADADKGLLAGKTVLVTAGPTREPIDPVRYITNRSSGKMGYAIAGAAAEQGARVILVSGPVSLQEPARVEVIHVKTAEQMYAATHENIEGVDIFIAAAAVSDYRPADTVQQKIKKSAETMSLDLVRSRDILASVAALEGAPFTVGFAAETENVREYALGKLENKKLDMIVANRVGDECGFDSDDNAVDIYWHDGEEGFPMSAKTALAPQIVALIAARYDAGNNKQQGKGLHAVH